MTFVAADPGGSSGAIAAITPNGLVTHNMPDTQKDILDLFRSLCFSEDGKSFAILESVHSMPGQGVSSSFKFGQNFGHLEMALLAAEIPYELATPKKWMKALGCMTGGDKTITHTFAQKLFPGHKITKRQADAVCMAVYAQRKHTGTL
jgi:Holliday junction resolvasome RuvABC endonuclease subunit